MKTIILKGLFVLICWIGMTSAVMAEYRVMEGEDCLVDVIVPNGETPMVRVQRSGSQSGPISEYVEIDRHENRLFFKFLKYGQYILTFYASDCHDWLVVVKVQQAGTDQIPSLNVFRTIILESGSSRLLMSNYPHDIPNFERMPIKESDDVKLLLA